MNNASHQAWLDYLAEKIEEGTATAEEQEYFNQWFNSLSARAETDENTDSLDASRASMHQHLQATIQAAPGKRVFFTRMQYAAAAALVLLCTGLFLFRQPRHIPQQPVASTTPPTVIEPGGSKATLTFSNGNTVQLSALPNGVISGMHPVTVSKSNEAIQFRQSTSVSRSTQTLYSTIRTPAGGEYKVTLPDGTTVKLNALTTLSIPDNFGLTERRLTLQGEAYFEVTANKNLPLIVTCNQQVVEVLGTSFNINSYDNEPEVVTTLASGLVKVHAGGKATLLKPGQQSNVSHNGQGSIKITSADSSGALAWKNGEIRFTNAPLPVIMRQIARWYNIRVVYAGQPPAETYTGGIKRNCSLNTLLEILKDNNIRFHITKTATNQTLTVYTANN